MSAEQFGPPGFVEFVHSFGCVIARERGGPQDCDGPVELAHIKSRGAGGGWKNNSLGLCRHHHQTQHALGIVTFQKRNETDLDFWACAITGKWEASQSRDAA